jgi:hypothetical protein
MVILQSSGLLVGGEVRTINLSWVASGAGGKPSAGVLPNLPPPVPMETKLCEVRSNSRVLPVVKLYPNPPANDFGQFPKARRFVIQQIQHFLGRKSAIVESPSEINPLQLAFSAKLCGPVLEPLATTKLPSDDI